MVSFVSFLWILLFSLPITNSFSFHTIQTKQKKHASKSHSFTNPHDGWIQNAFRSKTALTSSTSSSSSSVFPIGIQKDVLIIGGGLAGLSIALKLAQSGRQVTLLEKSSSSENVASFAAAGMLAPQSERLPLGPLLDLCLQSRRMYTEFVQNVEHLAQHSGQQGQAYLWHDNNDEKVKDEKPWEVGFQATGGFLAPAFAGDSVATWSPPSGTGKAFWLDEIQVRELEPQIHSDVIGGWWFPEDASVDARRLTCSLRAACVTAGVNILMGPDVAASSLELSDGSCTGVHTADGRIFHAKSIIIANGAWMRELLPVPITPHKGQSFSLRMPPNQPPLLSRVLFAQDTYIVPKSDGRIVVGATVEPGSFDPHVTPSGLMHCMTNAIALVPALADLPLEETWSGLRPTTPDKGPILGTTHWTNLYIAGGYWRNGVLLAPKTAQLMSDLINDCLSPEDDALLKEFSWDRFTTEEGGAKIAAASRYAASMHPVHKRASGMGVSASVGTELGFYSTAKTASSERKRDREALFGSPDSNHSESEMDNDAFEKAARMGMNDIKAFVRGNKHFHEANSNPSPSKYESPATSSSIVNEEQPSTSTSTSTSTQHSKQDQGVYDGYTEIQKANGSDSRIDELESMRAARIQNRGSAYDESHIGVKSQPQPSMESNQSSVMETNSQSQLESVYEQVRINKAETNPDLEMGDKQKDDRPDFPFRIYRIDEESGEQYLVPPYTTQAAMEEMIQNKNATKITKEPNDHDLPLTPQSPDETINEIQSTSTMEESKLSKDETPSQEGIYDGYSTILNANGSYSRTDELDAMRKARVKNRGSSMDEDRIGAKEVEP